MPFVVYDGEEVYREALEGFQKQLDDLKKGNSKKNTKEEDEASETSMRKTTRQRAAVVCNRLVDDGVTEDPTIVFEEQLSKLAAHRGVSPIPESPTNVTTRSMDSFLRARNIWE